MDMRAKLLILCLVVVLPRVASAQEAKLVNCRTLEAAGNFVGPDEVIVDDLVCQKAKPGTDPAAKPAAQKPVIGVVVSDAPVENVVDAAKAAEKRVATRREQETARNAVPPATDSDTPEPVAPPVAATPATNARDTLTTVPAASMAASVPEPAPSAPAPTAQPDSQPVAAAPEPAASAVASTPVPAPTAAAVAPPQPAPQVEAPVAPAARRESVTPGSQSPPEIVIPSAPASASASALAPQTEEHKADAPADAAPATTADRGAALTEPAPAVDAAPSDTTHPATSSGFYDANAPKHNSNAAAQSSSGFASEEQVNAGLAPGATSVPAADRPAAEAAAAQTDPEPQHTTIAAARIDFDADRERAVKLGDFGKPQEISPDPNAEHRTSVDASDADGFQDRQRSECTRNITLGGLKGERLVLGVPGWAAKNEKHMPQICFSETPMKGARNYLIVFSTPGGPASKDLADAAVDPAKESRAAGVGTFTTLYGSTWHYSVDRNVGTTVLTTDDADEPHGSPGQVLYATAYTEEGVPVSQRWPGQLKKEIKSGEKNKKQVKSESEALEHVSSDLLSQMVEDIEKL